VQLTIAADARRAPKRLPCLGYVRIPTKLQQKNCAVLSAMKRTLMPVKAFQPLMAR
jgi:hypothetical protein